jgi:hypothetical protein
VKVSGEAVEQGALHAAALDGWALLLPLLAPAHAAATLNRAPGVARLAELLQAHALEVRLSAAAVGCPRTVSLPFITMDLRSTIQLDNDSRTKRQLKDGTSLDSIFEKRTLISI